MTYADLKKILNYSAELNFETFHIDDCIFLKQVVDDHFKTSLLLVDCYIFWIRHSAKQDAQWLDPKAVTSEEILESVVDWAYSLLKQGIQ